jgi:amino acid permease
MTSAADISTKHKKGWRKHVRNRARQHVNPKLQRSLRIFMLVFVVLLGFVVFEAVRDRASFIEVIMGLIIGMLVGLASGRMYKISWDEQARHVTNSFDVYGVIVLVLYILFSIFRSHLAALFANSDSVGAVSLAILAGGMYGRVIANARSIARLLREQYALSLKRPDSYSKIAH